MKTFTKKMIVILFAILSNFQLYSQTEKLVVISADRLKILYVGIDNPVSIAVQGITSDKLKVSISNGTIIGSNGKYIVKPGQDSISIIEVTAEIKPGEIKKVGCDTFIIKRIPDPIPSIGKYISNSYISKDELLKNAEINVSLNLPFDLNFEVISFSFTYKENNNLITKKVIGNKFTQEIITAINNLKVESKVYFEDIKAKGPDGAVRRLSPIVIKLAEKE
jgi:hypothetical protein